MTERCLSLLPLERYRRGPYNEGREFIFKFSRWDHVNCSQYRDVHIIEVEFI